MPKPRKHPKSARPVNRIFKDIRAKPLIWMSTPQIQETHNVMWQGEQGDARGPITHAASRNVAALSSFNIALENTRAPTPGTVHNSIGESPLGHCPFGNDNRGTSHQNQNHPNDCPCNPLSPIKTGGVYQHLRNGTDMVPDAPPTRPPEPGVYAVGVEVGSGTEPLCAIFNSQADYSCMIASVAERLPNVVIRNTTPSQRRKWYSTPAGQVFDPQRYAELDLKAFEPYIPRLKLSMLLLESDGPTDGVHIYLGGPVFRKLATLGVPLSVREMVGQSIGSGVMGIAVGYDETTEVPGKRAVKLQDDMQLMSITFFKTVRPSRLADCQARSKFPFSARPHSHWTSSRYHHTPHRQCRASILPSPQQTPWLNV